MVPKARPNPPAARGASAIAYIRASTEDQELTLSIQAEKIAAYCVVRGLHLAASIEDSGVSGSVPLAKRPAGRRLGALLRRHGASHVIGLKLDRLFRDAADCLSQTKAWDRAGVALHLIDMGGGAVDTSGPMGRMVLTVFAGFAEFERALIAERTRAALRHKKQAGGWVGGGVPYGKRAKGGRLVDEPGEMAAIAQARRFRAEGKSYRGAAEAMTSLGYVKRNGQPLDATQIRRMVIQDIA